MSKQTILVIEDEKNILELIEFNLSQEGYKVEMAMDGVTGLDCARDKKVDLVLLDLMLPGLDGLEICKILRQNEKTAQIPIIMLTAKGEESDKVIGLELGADDYVVKPFSPRELVARVKAIFRRSHPKEDISNHFEVGQLELDNEKHQVFFKGKEIKLTSKEFRLLGVLLEAKGRLLTREMLLEKVWGYDSAIHIETRTVDMHIGQLRKKIQTEAKRLVTVKNAGYRFDYD